MTLRIVQQASLPVDLVGFTEVLFGIVSARALNDAEALLKDVAPEATVALELGSLVEHLGDPAVDSVSEVRHAPGLPRVTIRALDLPSRFKVTPILLIKEGNKRVQPSPDDETAEGDTLVVMGKSEDILAFEAAGLPIPA